MNSLIMSQTVTTDFSGEMLFSDLRIHQGMMGSTSRGITIQESEPDIFKNQLRASHQKDSGPISSALVKKEVYHCLFFFIMVEHCSVK